MLYAYATYASMIITLGVDDIDLASTHVTYGTMKMMTRDIQADIT